MAVMNVTGGRGGDRNAVPENIRKGVAICGVEGTLNPVCALTEAAYAALPEKDPDTLYIIVAG